MIFHRQASLERERKLLRAHNSLLHEVQMVKKKAKHYLGDLHSAELDLFSHKEEWLRIRS